MNTIEEDEAPKDAEAGDLIPHSRRHDVKDGQHSVAAPGEGNTAGVDNMLQAVDGITVAEALNEITGVEPAIDKTGRLPRWFQQVDM